MIDKPTTEAITPPPAAVDQNRTRKIASGDIAIFKVNGTWHSGPVIGAHPGHVVVGTKLGGNYANVSYSAIAGIAPHALATDPRRLAAHVAGLNVLEGRHAAALELLQDQQRATIGEYLAAIGLRKAGDTPR